MPDERSAAGSVLARLATSNKYNKQNNKTSYGYRQASGLSLIQLLYIQCSRQGLIIGHVHFHFCQRQSDSISNLEHCPLLFAAGLIIVCPPADNCPHHEMVSSMVYNMVIVFPILVAILI